MDYVIACLLLFLIILTQIANNNVISMSMETKYFQTPMHEIMHTEVYLSVNDYEEIIVTYSGKGTDMRPNDYITHADGIRILTGGLDEFIKTGEKEAIVPVIDDEDFKHGGYRLKGFMLLQSVQPRKLSTRRGEIFFDLEEGGPAPAMKIGNIVISKDGPKVTSDPTYQPPPHGGGQCLTSRDCFYHNGTCTSGQCNCLGAYTGTFCQLYRPEYAAVTKLMKKTQQQQSLQKDKISTVKTAQSVIEPVKIAQSVIETPRRFLTEERIVSQNEELIIIKDTQLLDHSYKTNVEPQDHLKVNREVESQAHLELNVETMSKITYNEEGVALIDSTYNEASANPQHDEGKQYVQLLENGVGTDIDKRVSETDSASTTHTTAGSSDGTSTIDDSASTTHTTTDSSDATSTADGSNTAATGKRRKKRKAQPADVSAADTITEDAKYQQSFENTGQKQQPSSTTSATTGVMDNQRQREDILNELYGEGKTYPEPYVAGKLPNSLIHERYKKRFNRETFIYSVRFRVGPFGITFDNKYPDKTVVQKLAKGEQAELSDIKDGDRLIAVDHYNVTTASAKSSQRIMSQLNWPRTLVFEVKPTDQDPREKELELLKRTFQINIVYPPSLVSEFQIKLSEWGAAAALKIINEENKVSDLNPYAEALSLYTPLNPYLLSQPLLANRNKNAFCPIFRLKTASDLFGCKNNKQKRTNSGSNSLEQEDDMSGSGTATGPVGEFAFPTSFDEFYEKSANAQNEELELESQFLSILLHESKSNNLYVEPRSAAFAKRGDCTFIEKARSMQQEGAHLGIVVNSDNELIELPPGREKISDINVHVGIVKEADGSLALLAGSTNEIWIIVTEAQSISKSTTTAIPTATSNPNNRVPRGRQAAAGRQQVKPTPIVTTSESNKQDSMDFMTPACAQLMMLVEDIIDKWPHSVPAIPTKQIISSVPPDKPRGLTEEGGRLALSGQNGWAFFDYHLAMFGPQELPLGPFKLQMALPPFGCDPASYSVRIQGTVVAILRGGGCSFGIKVINAQKLGAKAVIIVNTDDMKTMRLMALPDEVPLITIPCIMVSRRIQFYLEQQLRPFFPIDQHIISMQPTGIFGEYEKRNQLKLPQRI